MVSDPLSKILVQVVLTLASIALWFVVPLHAQSSRDSSHVVITEFADFECPFCGRQAPDLRRLQAEYPNRVSMVFKNFPLSFHARSRSAHLAALSAAEQGKFWEMHDLLFSHPDHLSIEDFDHYASQLGLDMEKFHEAMKDPSLSKKIEVDIQEGQRLGVTGTPTFLVNGHTLVGVQSYLSLKHIIDSELAGEPWQESKAFQSPAEVDTSYAPSRGALDAPITVIEFSDFQCPYCAQAIPSLKQLLSSNSNVRWVFKNFPLEFHSDSRLAHMAALAAGRQGKFWEMHDLIFSHQANIKREALISLASELQLNLTKFRHDLDDSELKKQIEMDKNDGVRLGVDATPTFIVNGEMVSGFSQSKLEFLIARPHINKSAKPENVPVQIPEESLSMGPSRANLHIDWYVDLTSPLISRSAFALQEFMAARPGQVQVRFRNFPLPNHDNAYLVHEYVLAAAAQGKFRQAESLLIADPRIKDRDELKRLSSALHLDQDRLWKEVDAKKYQPLIESDMAHAKQMGIAGSPVFVYEGKKFDGVDGLLNIQ